MKKNTTKSLSTGKVLQNIIIETECSVGLVVVVVAGAVVLCWCVAIPAAVETAGAS